MSEQPETLLKTRLFNVVRHRVPLDDGQVVVREWVQHPGAVTVLPLLDDGRVCLIRNQRTAVGETLIELPAGTLEPDEDPEQTARRELTEETGYRCSSLRKIHEFFMSPGILNERMHLFLATGLVAGEASPEAGEQIETFVVPWSEAINMALGGEIQDSKTLVGLLCYDRLKQEVQ